MMTERNTPAFPEGTAIVYCDGAFATPYGKTAHGLVRRTKRYRLASVIDARHAGRDAGEVLDGRVNGVPLVADLETALQTAEASGSPATHFVIGIAPDGGRLSPEARGVVRRAIDAGLHVDAGLHDHLSADPDLVALAAGRGVRLRDVRKPPPVSELHFWSGKITEVDALRVALLGTDSAVGKRTTGWVLADALEGAGHKAELVGTGQTAWMQGVRYGIVLDSLVNDFVSGELEHAVWRAWNEARPDVLLIEGQGSLLNPAYPGGFEILAATHPDAIVLQHAPARQDYDGFPGHPVHPIEHQIKVLELVSEKPVVAITLSHENLDKDGVARAAAELRERTGLPVCDPLWDGASEVVEALGPYLSQGAETAS